jgi:hypothetical protein
MRSTTSSAKVPPGGPMRHEEASAGKTPITKKQILVLCYIAGAIVLVVAAWLIWKKTRPELPRLDAPTPQLVRYTMSEDFQKQPFDMQAQFMKQLDARNERDKTDPNKGKEIDKAFASGQINETEYRYALQLAWFGKHLDRVDKYFSQGGPQRVAYVDELVFKKLNEDEEEKRRPKPPKENDISGNPSALEEKARIDKWPPEVRERWYQFQREYSIRKDRIEDARAKTRPAASK